MKTPTEIGYMHKSQVDLVATKQYIEEMIEAGIFETDHIIKITDELDIWLADYKWKITCVPAMDYFETGKVKYVLSPL